MRVRQYNIKTYVNKNIMLHRYTLSISMHLKVEIMYATSLKSFLKYSKLKLKNIAYVWIYIWEHVQYLYKEHRKEC